MIKTRSVFIGLAVIVAACSALLGTYTYYYTDSLTSINTSYWTENGTLTAGAAGLTSSNADGGSLISKVAVPDGSSNYEVKTTLTLTQSGGTYVTYLRASANALSGPAAAGTAYAIEVQNPTFSGSACTAGLVIYQIVSGSVTALESTTMTCHNGVTLRVINNSSNDIAVYVDDACYFTVWNSSIVSGQPGIGVRGAPSGNSIAQVQLGGIYAGNPLFPTSEINVSAFANKAEIQWPGASEPNGPGIAYYLVYRNGALMAEIGTDQDDFYDDSVSASTTYTYLIEAYDYDVNVTVDTLTIATPPTGAIDPREVGVRPTGSYWGGGGEQIDMRSGNLNYTIPILKVMGRGGWSVGFNLAYNSQNWRQDPGGTWQLGEDVGYGYGWKLLAGSLLPFETPSGIGEYLFTDATGAQYHLNQNSGSLWTSIESVYVTYDASTGELHFNDGSFWVMGCTSAGTEWDAGTMYPTLMEDSNGNQVTIKYNDGIGVTWNNSSSRINTIADVRAYAGYDYGFTYNTDAIPHLTGITNSIGTAENYSFAYLENYSLTSPYGGQAYGSVTLLQSSTVTGIPLTTRFTYDNPSATTSCSSSGTGASGPGELTQVTTPYCGHLRWTYAPYTLSGSRTYREVQNRYLSMSSGAAETTISLVRGNDSPYTVHSSATLEDAAANAEKYWTFQTASAFNLGLQLSYEELTLSTGTPLSLLDFTWAQTPTSLNPYIGTTVTKLNPGQSYEADKQTTQTLDQYGNVLTMQVYNFGAGAVGSLARTYTNTYLVNSNYEPLYILNRLLTSTVTDGTNTATLVSNSYDTGTLTNVTGTLYEHDSNYSTGFIYRGNVTSSITPTTTTANTYDITGNLTQTTVNGVTNSVTTTSTTNYAAPAQITTNTLYSSMNWSGFLGLSSAAGPNGDTASITYDTNARPHTTTSPYGAVTTYAYGDTASPPYKLATTNTRAMANFMDGFGRTFQTNTADSVLISVVSFVYAPCGCSPLGKLSQQSRPYLPGDTVAWTTYTYDASGRTLSVVLPDGSTTSYVYQGNQVTVTDPAGKWKIFTMDAFGNLVSVVEPDPTLGNVTTNYTYDVLNHLTQVSMPRGTATQTRTFNYNSGATVTGFLQSATNPENGTVTYTYNANSLLASKTDAKGQHLTYQYDTYNRLTSLTWTNSPTGAQVLRTYMYDTNTLDGTFSGYYTAGRLVAVQNAQFTPGNGSIVRWIQMVEMYGYTQAGSVSGKRLQVNESLNGTTSSARNLDALYTYTNEGKVASVNYPTTWSSSGSTPGPTYTYGFDGVSRPITLTDQSNNVDVTSVTYNAANQLLSVTYFDQAESRVYNSLGQLTQLSSTGAANMNYSYNFPAGANNGKIGSSYNAVTGETIAYQYDSLNRLISAAGSGWGDAYGFDGFGNLLSKTVTAGSAPSLSQAVNSANNQIVGQGYDANGNQTSPPNNSGELLYDAENRLTQNGVSVQYAYDSQNKRVWVGTLVSGSLTSQSANLYGIDGQMLGTYSLSVSTTGITDPATSLSVYFGRKRVAIVAAGVTTPFVQDRLGSNMSWQVNRVSLYPWGEDRGTPAPNDQIKFATYTRDSATLLDYADQRYYSNIGRFMSPDPSWHSVNLRNPQSWNRYAYVIGDPVNFNDPNGLDAFGGDGGVCPDITLAECGGDDPGIPDLPLPQGGSYPISIPTSLTYPINDGPGFTGSLGINLTNGSMAFQFDPTSGGVLVGICIAQPELCGAVIVGGVITVYVVQQYGSALFSAIMSALKASSWKAGSFPNVQEVQSNCAPVGGPVIVPSTTYPGGQSIEQEYLCPDGNNYTIHTLTNKNGKIMEIHVRPGPPKYGSN